VIQRVGLNDVTVAVDGSLYRFHPHFKQLMSSKISQLLPPHLQVQTRNHNDTITRLFIVMIMMMMMMMMMMIKWRGVHL